MQENYFTPQDNSMEFDFNFDRKDIDIETTMHCAIALMFTGGPATTNEGPELNKISTLLAIPDIDCKTFGRKGGWSDDGMAYNTPWYTYDKRFSVSRNYRSFVWAMRRYFSIELASLFFTKDFQEIVTPENLTAIDRVYFNDWYLQWT